MSPHPAGSSPVEWIARNPSSGEELARGPLTPPDDIPAIVERARAAQGKWSSTTLKDRARLLQRWSERLSSEGASWTTRIVQEAGKPRAEALMELLSTLDQLAWTIRHGPRALRSTRVGSGRQILLLMGGATVRRIPRGVVGVWGTWNYPLFLALPAIAHAILAGNGVVFKASENVPGLGAALRQSWEEADPPADLVGWIFGGVEQGRALASSSVDFGHFTGGLFAHGAV